ncbi:hypothetical protein [Litchfieldia salsa]|uniref:Uncharacterized protein n=1 Tax=Litchfieldia salsa TaxID=930152 RepID=A0A1H0U1E1_9BACI|nr:hypothetical protein [Litchfieldia salsa]SDP59999.1 hypothetical protein SAMN05216565_10484 [Litchfieldia salsa]
MVKAVKTKNERKKKVVVNEKHKDKDEAWQRFLTLVEAKIKR